MLKTNGKLLCAVKKKDICSNVLQKNSFGYHLEKITGSELYIKKQNFLNNCAVLFVQISCNLDEIILDYLLLTVNLTRLLKNDVLSTIVLIKYRYKC